MMSILKLSLVGAGVLVLAHPDAVRGGSGGQSAGDNQGVHGKHGHAAGHLSRLVKRANNWIGRFTFQCDLVLDAVDADGNWTVVQTPNIVQDRNLNEPGLPVMPGTEDLPFNITEVCAGGLFVQQYENLNQQQQASFIKEAEKFMNRDRPFSVEQTLQLKRGFRKAAKLLRLACDDVLENKIGLPEEDFRVNFAFKNWKGEVEQLPENLGFDVLGFCHGIKKYGDEGDETEM